MDTSSAGRPAWQAQVEPPPPITASGLAAGTSPTPTDLYLTVDDVALYPQPGLYSGDAVTIDVTPRNLGTSSFHSLVVGLYRKTAQGEEAIALRPLSEPAGGGLPRARMNWLWITAGLEGEQTLIVRLDPGDHIQRGDEDPANNVITLTVPLGPAAARPPIEMAATWAMTNTEGCRLHYLTGTAAERDLTQLVAAAEKAVAQVQAQTGIATLPSLDVYLLSRVMGRGAYSGDGLALSYLDRAYVQADPATQMRYEVARNMDWTLRLIGPACPLLQEGLATWLAGGTYWPMSIPQSASALVELGRTIPVPELAGNFYRHPANIARLEAGAFAAYLVETYGWEKVLAAHFSTDCSPPGLAGDLDLALNETLGAGLEDLEAGFLDWLAAHPPTPEEQKALVNTLAFFETVLRYQERYDPAASFARGTLPDPALGVRLSIEADFLRHPRSAEQVALETVLLAAQEALQDGTLDQAEELLAELNRALDEGSLASPLVADHLAIVETVAAAGSEAQRIEIEGDTARVWVISKWPVLVELSLRRAEAGWTLD